MRSFVVETAMSWRTQNIWVGCSGNFTIERSLPTSTAHSNTAVDLLLDVWDRHRQDLQQHWLTPEHEPRTASKNKIPTTSLFGHTIPAEIAQQVAKRIRKAIDAGQIQHPWQILEEHEK